MLDAFRDMAQGILDVLGEDAFFNGATTPVKINVQHDVQLDGIGALDAQRDADMVFVRDVASISASLSPKIGDRFVQNGVTYRLEFPVKKDGALLRFVVMKVPS